MIIVHNFLHLVLSTGGDMNKIRNIFNGGGRYNIIIIIIIVITVFYIAHYNYMPARFTIGGHYYPGQDITPSNCSGCHRHKTPIFCANCDNSLHVTSPSPSAMSVPCLMVKSAGSFEDRNLDVLFHSDSVGSKPQKRNEINHWMKNGMRMLNTSRIFTTRL